MNARLTALDQMRLWCDGRMSLADIFPLIESISSIYTRADLVDAWTTLEEEGYTRRYVNSNRMVISPLDNQVYEVPYTEIILSPPKG